MPAAEGSNPIEAVRERLDGGRKWHKGSLSVGASVCLLGAGLDVPDSSIGMLRIREVIMEQFPDRAVPHDLYPDCAKLPEFNDHPDTTWADVDLVLDKAARRWDEQS